MKLEKQRLKRKKFGKQRLVKKAKKIIEKTKMLWLKKNI